MKIDIFILLLGAVFLYLWCKWGQSINSVNQVTQPRGSNTAVATPTQNLSLYSQGGFLPGYLTPT